MQIKLRRRDLRSVDVSEWNEEARAFLKPPDALSDQLRSGAMSLAESRVAVENARREFDTAQAAQAEVEGDVVKALQLYGDRSQSPATRVRFTLFFSPKKSYNEERRKDKTGDPSAFQAK